MDPGRAAKQVDLILLDMEELDLGQPSNYARQARRIRECLPHLPRRFSFSELRLAVHMVRLAYQLGPIEAVDYLRTIRPEVR